MLNVIICDAYFLEKFMKWKPLLSLFFCFSLLIPITSQAFQDVDGKYTGGNSTKPVNPNTAKNISKATKVVKVGAALKTANHIRKHKWKYAAGAVIVGATAASYYRNDIDRIIDNKFYSNKWRSEKKSELVPVLYKKIHNAKPEKQAAIIEAIQESLMYYIVMYDGQPFEKLATSVLNSLNIMTPALQKQKTLSLSDKANATLIINATLLDLKRKNQRPRCARGSKERNAIYEKNEYSKKNGNAITEIQLSEWDVDSFQKQSIITENYKKHVNNDRSRYYAFHKDHIPAKKAIEFYLERRDNFSKGFKSDIVKHIYNNATSVIVLGDFHSKGRTWGIPTARAKAESYNLEKSMIEDFIAYYVLYGSKGLNNATFVRKWSTAFSEAYLRNESLCLFI